MRVNKSNQKYLEPVLSGLVVIFGIILLIIHKIIQDRVIDYFFVIKPNNYYYTEWKDPTARTRVEIYFFNWTNAEDFMNSSVKPKFQELGPLVFSQELHRWNITFHKNNTVSFRNKKIFHLDEGESKMNYQENITSMNIVSVYAVEQSRKWNFVYRKGLSIALNGVSYHKTKKAKDWLFDGFEDPFLNSVKYLPFLDDIPDMDRFAWFYGKNGSHTYDGHFNVGTGEGNSSFGTVYKWNYRNRSDYNGECGEIVAPSEFFPQNTKKGDFPMFLTDLCRKIILEYNGTVVWHGIEVYRYKADVKYLDNGKYNAENKCLCNRKCLKYGVIDYSKCKYGFPGYLSFPHFHKADPKYRTDVEGMHPDDTKHKMEVLIEPRTGAMLYLDMGAQLNLFIEPNPSISSFRDVPEILLPAFWYRSIFVLDTKNIILVYAALRLDTTIRVIGCILIISGVVLYMRFHFRGCSSKNTRNKLGEKLLQENSILLLTNESCDESKDCKRDLKRKSDMKIEHAFQKFK